MLEFSESGRRKRESPSRGTGRLHCVKASQLKINYKLGPYAKRGPENSNFQHQFSTQQCTAKKDKGDNRLQLQPGVSSEMTGQTTS